MPKIKTDKSKYKSKYSGEYCTAKQYICDILMERKNKNIKLPFKYWSNEKYKKDYIKTLQIINKYCKLYNELAIISVLIQKDWIYSFFYPKFWELVENEEKKIDSIKIKNKEEVVGSEKFEKVNTDKSTNNISKFRNLDG